MAAIQHAANTRTNSVDKPVLGFVNFKPRDDIDRQIQDALNVIIHLNLQIVVNLKNLRKQIVRLLREKGPELADIDSVLQAIGKLSISEHRDLTPKPYIHWKEDE